MPTLDDILNNDLGLGEASVTKTASENVAETDEIEKIAMELGIITDSAATSQETNKGQIKEAHMSMDNLYNQLFPGDAQVVTTQEKTASSQTKEAAALEETMGAFAFDKTQEFVDAHIEKIATDIAALPFDGAPAQSMKSNEDTSNKAMDTRPQVQDQLMKDKVEGKVGDFSGQASPNGELKKQAMMKHFLIASQKQ